MNQSSFRSVSLLFNYNMRNMKKLVLSAALCAVLAIGGVSCSKSGSEDAAAAMTSRIENATNADHIKGYVDEAKAYAQKLVREGKVEEAKEYIAKIEPVVKEKAPQYAGVLESVSKALDKVGDVASDKLDDAKDAAGAAADSVGSAASSVADAAEAKAEELKDATVEKAKEVKDATVDKAKEVRDATVDAAQKGADKVKQALK